MNTFTPYLFSGIALTSLLVTLAIIGKLVSNFKNTAIKRIVAWSLVIVSLILCFSWVLNHPPFIRMIFLILTLFQGMKTLVLIEYPPKFLKLKLEFIFRFLWFGMNPIPFTRKEKKAIPGWKKTLFFGITRGLAGIIILILIPVFDPSSIHIFSGLWYLLSLLLLIALSLILHFGLLNITTAVLQLVGYPVHPIFKQPLQSKTLREFWGKRWNTAFSDMTATVAFKPLLKKVGRNEALLFAFLLSGLLHELAISVPVKSGFGLPLLYFLIHGMAMLAEHYFFKGSTPPKIWLYAFLVLPLPLLFHTTFLTDIVWKIMPQIALV